MTIETHAHASPAEVAHAILRRTGLTPERRGANRWVIDLRIEPERLQVARAEHALARRGYIPTLRGRRGTVRLEVIADGLGTLLRADGSVVLGGVPSPMSDAQRRVVARALDALARPATAAA